MLNFNTDDLDPKDRFDHWCEVRGKNLFGVTIELPREQRAKFQGRFSAKPLGGAVVSEMQASSYHLSRTPADIARVSGNSLCVSLQVRGPGLLDIGQDRIQAVRNGDLLISHSDLPYSATPHGTGGFEFVMLKIPLAGDIVLGAPAHDLVAERVAESATYLRPISALFNALTRPSPQMSDPATEITHIARLAMLVRGHLMVNLPEIRAALRSGFLHAAREIMVRDLPRQNLSPIMLATELGISLRQLHVLFEPTGFSFSRTLTTMRLEEACRLLKVMHTRPVTEIAFLSGFDSLATFYRAFRHAHGMTPGDMRAMSSED